MYAQQATWDDVPRPVRWMIRIVLVALIVGLGIRAYKADATPMPALNDTEFTIHVTPAQDNCQGYLAVSGEYHGYGHIVVQLERNNTAGVWVPASRWYGAITRQHGDATLDVSFVNLTGPGSFEFEQYPDSDEPTAFRIVEYNQSTRQSAVLIEEFVSTRSSRCA